MHEKRHDNGAGVLELFIPSFHQSSLPVRFVVHPSSQKHPTRLLKESGELTAKKKRPQGQQAAAQAPQATITMRNTAAALEEAVSLPKATAYLRALGRLKTFERNRFQR